MRETTSSSRDLEYFENRCAQNIEDVVLLSRVFDEQLTEPIIIAGGGTAAWDYFRVKGMLMAEKLVISQWVLNIGSGE